MVAWTAGLVWKGSSPTSHVPPGDGRTTLTLGWHIQPPKGNAGLWRDPWRCRRAVCRAGGCRVAVSP